MQVIGAGGRSAPCRLSGRTEWAAMRRRYWPGERPDQRRAQRVCSFAPPRMGDEPPKSSLQACNSPIHPGCPCWGPSFFPFVPCRSLSPGSCSFRGGSESCSVTEESDALRIPVPAGNVPLYLPLARSFLPPWKQSQMPWFAERRATFDHHYHGNFPLVPPFTHFSCSLLSCSSFPFPTFVFLTPP